MRYRLLSESTTATLPGGVAELRGWEVREERGAVVGAVRDAVLDDAGEVCYLDVQLANVIGARRVLLPIGFARPLPTARVVELPGLTRGDIETLLRALPKYEGSELVSVIEQYERRLGAAWSRDLTDQNSLGSVRSTDPDVPPPPGA
jgi:hypothetical protein